MTMVIRLHQPHTVLKRLLPPHNPLAQMPNIHRWRIIVAVCIVGVHVPFERVRAALLIVEKFQRTCVVRQELCMLVKLHSSEGFRIVCFLFRFVPIPTRQERLPVSLPRR
jgi:hypothetical protein